MSALTAAALAFCLLPPDAAIRVLLVCGVGTVIAGLYGRSVLGGVMGDFLGATICMLELAVYLAIAADDGRADAKAIARLGMVLAAPQLYGAWRRRYDASVPEPKAC